MKTSQHPKRTDSVQQRKFTSINKDTSYTLCFLRHGQSTWNRDNRFIGWTDTPLTDDGVLEARVAGQMLANSGMKFDEVHTSMLRRCIRTTNLVLMELGQEYLPVYKHWRLNERHYGDLVGKNKKETVELFGRDQVKRWRRSYDEPPPPMTDDHEFNPVRDPRYRSVSCFLDAFRIGWNRFTWEPIPLLTNVFIDVQMMDQIPKSESLLCTKRRSSVYWDDHIAPSLREGKTVLVVGHENNLRSLIMRLEGISPDDIINLCLPRAVPLAYRLDENLNPVDRPDGKLDEATGFLRGEWLGGDQAVAEILERDRKQVYDTSIKHNLELDDSRKKWSDWMSFVVGKPSPEARAKAELEQKVAA
jgi:2,3-bisphosphoglycerate-dependent phosphoglycerate mutase